LTLEFPEYNYGGVVFTQDGLHAVIDADFRLIVWNLKKGKEVRRIEGTHGSGNALLAVSADGRRVLATPRWSGLSRIMLFDLQTGEKIRTFDESSDILDMTFSPDGRYALSGGYKTVQLWELPK
jgi:WD40 repeat protein